MGGTSYGIYQFSSKQGTISSFIRYLQHHAKDIAEQLEKAGVSNTGSTKGSMPIVWQNIAKKESERFAHLQHAFAVEYYYTPIATDFSNSIPKHRALDELLFSTAIQHGVQGASSIIQQALPRKEQSIESFIRTVYSLRKEQFRSSTKAVQTAVHNRLTQEMNTILNLYIS